MNDATIDILLATYNGARFLPEQLASLERQTISSWRLIARDDGSTDATPTILAEFRARHPGAVQLVHGEDRRLGVVGNYARLLDSSTADLLCFCDQDDVWMPDKLERLVALTRGIGRDVPLLVHSDLEVVDDRMQMVAPSFWRYQFIRPERCRWPQLLVQNVVTGCATMINGRLREASRPIPTEAVMHDWWLALVAAIAGEIRWLPAPTVKYRQHHANDTGAKRWGRSQWQYTCRALVAPAAYRDGLRMFQRQAGALANHAGVPISDATRSTLRQFAQLQQLSFPDRVRFVGREGILKTGLIRNLVYLRNI